MLTVWSPLCGSGGISFRSCVRSDLMVELSGAVAAMTKGSGIWGLYVTKFSVLKVEFQYPAFVGLVMYLCEIDLCLGLDWSY